MINGKTTSVQRDGVMVYDVGRPYVTPAIFRTQEQADKAIAKMGSWADRIVRVVKQGDIIPFHHHTMAYWGYPWQELTTAREARRTPSPTS